MPVERRLLMLTFLMMTLALLALGQAAIKANARTNSEDFLRFSNVLTEAYEIIEQHYVDPIDDAKREKLYEAAIQGMFTSLDDHSQFLNADMYEQLNKETEGGFSGVGIHITLRNGVLTVIAPIPRSPAARVGIRPWDRIVKIEGEETRDITIQDAVSRLTGPQGTKVTITIYRPSEQRSFDVTITRAQVKVNSVYSQMLDADVGYVRLAKFSTDTSGDLKNVLLSLQKKGAKGILLDLRYNTGGLLKEAIDVSSLFLEKETLIVSTKGRDEGQNQEFRSQHDPVTRLPIIILANNGSASASEIVAAALRDNGRAIILGPKGQKTYGKWSVQTIEEMRNSLDYDKEGNPRRAAVRLTTARYYSPKGETFHKEGLKFDEELDIPQENEARLLMEGQLLGDPSLVEEKESQLDHFPSEEELNGAPPQNGKNSEGGETKSDDALTSPATSADDKATTPGATKPPEPFKDLLLEHAVRLMKTHILLTGKKAA